MKCPNLFKPLAIRGAVLANRILSSGHDTVLPTDGRVNEALIAYHAARAQGGVGLIVLQVSGVHATARYTTHMLMATEDAVIPGYRRLAKTVHRHGTSLFAQLFHPGREIMESEGGLLAVAYAPSAIPNERFHVMPRRLDRPMIAEIVAGYGDAARRMHAADLDGVEIVASHGYLPAQFLNPRINQREDEYGGSHENRRRFIQEIIADIRAKTSEDFVIGLRISGGERDEEGLSEDEALAAITALSTKLDYVHVTAGTSASLGGAIHIAPPMTIPPAYLASYAAKAKAAVSIPVFVTGRINQPQDAESIIAAGQADVCGMTRALIADPHMPNKARAGRFEDIRACIACNQACIGHFHRGHPISCIQHPVTGREMRFGKLSSATPPRRIMVVGGGPAGMKCAAVAAGRGHRVTLYEASRRLGGQALLAQLLPGRSEFGGVITNLERELEQAKVEIRTGMTVTPSLIAKETPDMLVLATGAVPFWPAIERGEGMQIVDAWQVLKGEVRVGASVLVADWRCDWIGIGIAELLAQAGSRVQLAVNGVSAGEVLPLYVRDHSMARLHRAAVSIRPFMRLYGCDGDTVYLQHTPSGEAVVVDGIDTLVLCHGHRAVTTLGEALTDYGGAFCTIGDGLAPRTAEEAIFEGFTTAAAL